MAIITGTADADSLVGGVANDEISGLGGNDTLNGGGGNDILSGGAGQDRLLGGNGSDFLVGSGGRDTLNGGSGNDTYVIEYDDILKDAGGIDTVRLNSFYYTLPVGFENLVLTGSAISGTGNNSANAITGNNSANQLKGEGGKDTLIGGGGNDTLDGGSGADVLLGGEGNDLLTHTAGDTVDGGAGTDRLRIGGSGVTLDLTAIANDVHTDIEVIALMDTGNNVVRLNAADVVAFSTSTDTVRVDGNAGDRVVAPDGNWTFVQNEVTGGQTYARYTNDEATLQVDVDIDRTGIAQSSIDLSALDGFSGFRLVGPVAGNGFGYSVAAAGDVNGDGFGDVIVGAPFGDPGGYSSGASFVVFGKASAFGSSVSLTLYGQNGFRLDGVAPYDGSGHSVSAAGDVNGDGFGDVIVGADAADTNGNNSGDSYVVFGKASGFTATIKLSSLEGTNGFRLEGAGAGHYSGHSVSTAGDVNGDGFDDLIVGAPYADPGGVSTAGESYVVFGKASGFSSNIDLAMLDGSSGFRLSGVSERDHSGYSVACAGDVNGDGFDDLIVGARYGSSPYSGVSYVVFGKAATFNSSMDLAGLDGANGFRFHATPFEDYGLQVASAGDINGDGFGDLLISASRYVAVESYENTDSYVIFGKASGFSSSITADDLNGENGFRIDGIFAYEASGFAAASAGDVNGDGFDDLILGVRQLSGLSYADTIGESYVVFGKASGFASSIGRADLDGTNGFRVDGIDPFDFSGQSVSSAGDLNGDGFDDVIIGARDESYVLFGRDFTGVVTHLGTSSADALTGTAAAERFVSAQGNDTLTGGGGADVFNAGAGNDLIHLSNLAFAEIDGGSGTDTLAILGSGRTLNLVLRPNNEITGIERIDLTGTGSNTLKLSHRDLFDMSDTTNQLRVDGNAGDTVDLVGAWADSGAGAKYHTYTLGAATILIDNDIFVT